jgi:magnesium chelatase family protein
LFLDELPEFSPPVLDALRQPIETGRTVIARANHRVSYPSQFQLVAAMNPCRCGRAGEPGFSCKRGTNCVETYQARISGPLWDRIDMQVEMPAVTLSELTLPQAAEGSSEVALRVLRARKIQSRRYHALGARDTLINARCPPDLLDQVAKVDNEGMALLVKASASAKLSARGYHRTLRVARTIADLDGAERIGRHHLAEALALRKAAAPLQTAA